MSPFLSQMFTFWEVLIHVLRRRWIYTYFERNFVLKEGTKTRKCAPQSLSWQQASQSEVWFTMSISGSALWDTSAPWPWGDLHWIDLQCDLGCADSSLFSFERSSLWCDVQFVDSPAAAMSHKTRAYEEYSRNGWNSSATLWSLWRKWWDFQSKTQEIFSLWFWRLKTVETKSRWNGEPMEPHWWIST